MSDDTLSLRDGDDDSDAAICGDGVGYSKWAVPGRDNAYEGWCFSDGNR